MTDASSYRWYLCVQHQLNPTKWDCARVEGDKALYPFCDFDYKSETNSKAIPISKWKPKLLDPLILHYSLHPKIQVTSVTYPS